MSLTKDQVRQVAMLARLKVTDDEVEAFTGQLSTILDYINQLSELETDNVAPTSHSFSAKNVFREDIAKTRFEENAWRKNAPSEDHGHLRVPRVIEEQ
ncbi:Aspartyl-tRNA(Asn) amidotransferase subunit C @ Glutamyl-tRNA(Gln) amidotransferase subunit C [hydrothermal vent metagenome]|uniref:Aspartyl-tRNA(Asn) amidotransferase subunit C @ Glutamyl-tRNA(Gln) amidotransferase subunit C n=1 Tax=hydrothermal vent metagenome TaxID=652676 RepID=A0A3B1BH04_9ZZZZ